MFFIMCPHFYIAFFSLLRDAENKKGPRAHSFFLWGAKMRPGAHLRIREGPISGRQVLSVSVVLSESVEIAMECHVTC